MFVLFAADIRQRYKDATGQDETSGIAAVKSQVVFIQ